MILSGPIVNFLDLFNDDPEDAGVADPRGRVFRVAYQLQHIPVLDCLAVSIHSVDVDPAKASTAQIAWVTLVTQTSSHGGSRLSVASSSPVPNISGSMAFLNRGKHPACAIGRATTHRPVAWRPPLLKERLDAAEDRRATWS
jgi:hypothetical protein